MTHDEKIAIAQGREYIVAKANCLVQKSRFDLSLAEQKTIAYICSLIKPRTAVDRAKETPFILEYEFNIRDYCKICGFNYDAGKNYKDVKDTLKNLSDRSMWLEIGDEEVLCRWLAKVRTNKKSGIAHITIDEDLAPYLFDLQERFTQYQLYNILGMKSAYSVRMYELLKSYRIQKTKEFQIDELKELLMVQNIASYKDFRNFRIKVLEISLKEINELTDISVQYEPITKGRKVIGIRFTIKDKTPVERYLSANKAIQQIGEVE